MNKKSFGLPAEVSIYSPIEFLELDKMTAAFLKIGLETQRGGIQNQLLCGHVVDFVQREGVDSINTLPRFKEVYLKDILEKCQTKGIDLMDLKNKPIIVDFDKLTKLSDDKLVYQSEDIFDKSANIYSSSNYSQFHKLEFNRKIVWSHVYDIRHSMLEHGILSYPLMIYTDCIDGTFKYWIVDGQHRFEAFRLLGLPIRFTLHQQPGSEPITRHDIVKLVARVNNTARKWNLHQYLKAWSSLEIEEYMHIGKVYNETRIAINILLQAYSGHTRTRATGDFVGGKYKMADRENGERYVQYLRKLKPLLTKSTTLQSAFLDLFRSTNSYNNDAMFDKLTEVKDTWVFPEKREEALESLKKLYALVA